MSTPTDRRTFLRRTALAGGGLAIAGPLQAFAARSALGATQGGGYGPLIEMGDLALPEGFRYEVISRAGELMSDGNPTPGVFDGTGAFPGARGTTILIRNHENRRRVGETPVVVPADLRYDPDPTYNAGNTKLVVDRSGRVREQFAILGGTSTNCAGGVMPWGTWIACEEVFDQGNSGVKHGYAFEMDAYATGPVKAVPIKAAGRFVQEAVVWDGRGLLMTEDRDDGALLYRYVPDSLPSRPKSGDLAASTGKLYALRIPDMPGAFVSKGGFPVDEPVDIDWVQIDQPDAVDNSTNSTRAQGFAKGAARFTRQEGAWRGSDGRVSFDCTNGGAAGEGQIWEVDVRGGSLRLVYESPGADVLKQPDNLTVVPRTNHLLLCEDADFPQFLRGLSPDGEIYDFARAVTRDTEFAGAVFDPGGHTLYVSQQGGRPDPEAATYAIRGPWDRVSGNGNGD